MSDARDALLWVMEMAHDNHPDSHGRIADDFLAKHEVVLRSDLMSVATLRATVRELVEGVTYASYYGEGKGAQTTLNASGRASLVRLTAMVSLEREEEDDDE